MKRALISCMLVLVLACSVAAADYSADIVVVGAGGAGLSAAVSAADNGVSVIVIEKMPFAGGNTTLSTGSVYAGGAARSLQAGFYYPPSEFANVIMTTSEGTCNERLARFVASESGLTVNWLEGLGVQFRPVAAPGSSNSTIPDGSGIIKPLLAACKERGVQVFLDTKGVALLVENGHVAGVQAEQKGKSLTIESKAVILATGGFAANRDMVAKYKPEYADLIVSCSIGSTGDGILMAQAIGAATIDMERVMPTPTAEINSKRLITAGMRNTAGAIIVNEHGQRFVDETWLYEPLSIALTEEMAKGTLDYVFEVFDEKGKESVPIAQTYVDGGLTLQADTLEGLAEKLGLAPDSFAKTVQEYNQMIKEGRPDPFGKTKALKPIETPPFYGIKIKSGHLATRGGLKINEKAQVLDLADNPIPGLYAAGEVTGGVFGGGYIGGGFLAEATVLGRVAGAQGAIDVLSR
ncbi:MAG: flavocytochrome c [Limnochordia bacterium]|jgi:fumarate reductase flavoprotein subunit